jgi:choline dehydrogenase
VLGGSGSINGVMQVRGQAEDFDDWAALGCRGWSYRDVLPYFKKSETYLPGDPAYRGKSGPLVIEDYRNPHPLTHDFVKAGQEIGLPYNPDHNGATQEGIGYVQQTRKGRWRLSTARAFLRPAMKRPNLKVETGVLVRGLVFAGNRVAGVTFARGMGKGQPEPATAKREVILAAGAINSPQLLQLSGIGAPENLQSIGVTVRTALPGVGANFHDHYATRVVRKIVGRTTVNEQARGLRLVGEVARFVFKGDGILTYSAGNGIAFARSRAELTRPDVQISFAPASYANGRLGVLDTVPGMTCGAWQCRPESRGSVLAKSCSPTEAPAIRPTISITRPIVLRSSRASNSAGAFCTPMCSRPAATWKPIQARTSSPMTSGSTMRAATAVRFTIPSAPARWAPIGWPSSIPSCVFTASPGSGSPMPPSCP